MRSIFNWFRGRSDRSLGRNAFGLTLPAAQQTPINEQTALAISRLHAI
jgi:hypothetical protein